MIFTGLKGDERNASEALRLSPQRHLSLFQTRRCVGIS